MAKFQTSARTVDMLGRQQIAGIPTALSELFKNAYDAYATEVRADFVESQASLVLRDDGIGMSFEDFHTRWLTIGTDSKARHGSQSAPPRPKKTAARAQMGEKGIGRLAIASIGPQLLVLSRPIPRELAAPSKDRTWSSLGVVALLQWTLFEVPGLTLDDVVVPLRQLEPGAALDRATLKGLGDEVRQCVAKLKNRVPDEYRERILTELKLLDFDPEPLLRLPGPDATAGAPGTTFLVRPVNEDLPTLIAGPDGDDATTAPLERFLLGFTNTMLPDRPPPPIRTEFIVHRGAGDSQDLIEPEKFWTPADFELVDHTIEGTFDAAGMFDGHVSIYGQEPLAYTAAWAAGQGQLTRCGPFQLTLGYVQGNANDSRLPPEDFAVMTAKLMRIGGLYIYRDGIRVLPYGNSDVDYLDIEQRRSRKASRAFFSYRRMVGCIEVSSGKNPELQEKAGREGFRENAAFRDFKSILKEFLAQVATDFFNEGGSQSSAWESERAALQRRAAGRRKREDAERRLRDRFATALADALDRLESGQANAEFDHLLTSLNHSLQAATGERDVAAAERAARERLEQLVEALRMRRPADIGLPVELERDWDGYVLLWRTFMDRDVAAAADAIQAQVDAASETVGSQVVAVQRVTRSQQVRDTQVELVLGAAQALTAETTHALAAASDLAQTAMHAFNETAERLLAEDAVPGGGQEILLLEELARSAEEQAARLDRVRSDIQKALSDNNDDDEIRQLKDQVLDLEAQADANLELLQLGLAVQVVSHEFEASIKTVRAGLRRLDPWARKNPTLAPTVRDLKASFQHLDSYLRLFTPLQRRLYRKRTNVSGGEIADFVEGVFADRLPRHGITLASTPTFRSWQLHGFPSTFYPVFVNLVDNAIYWVGRAQETDSRIVLDADDHSLYVRDSGPGVAPRDRESVFERGFSRRRGGRGLGLAIARDLLLREGWDLGLLPEPAAEGGAAFYLRPGSTP